MRNPFSTKPRVNVLRLQGSITAQGRGLNDAGLTQMIEAAFSKGRPRAVALAINCPGGSAVQSSLIAARIRRLSEEKEIPVTAFVEDVAASGGYWLASAADEIIADRSSILGSIGVIAAGFGLHELAGRVGVERRVHTAGTSKSFLDPFRPEDPKDVDRLKDLLDQMHGNFIAQVKARRPHLADEPDLFTGAFWLGTRAVELGLADGLGHMVPHMKARYGRDVQFRTFKPRRSLLERFGGSAVEAVTAGIEERAAYARFGL